MNFLLDGPAKCSTGEGMFERVSGSRRSLPRKVAWRGQIMRVAALCLAPALALKIDAAPFQKFDPFSLKPVILCAIERSKNDLSSP